MLFFICWRLILLHKRLKRNETIFFSKTSFSMLGFGWRGCGVWGGGLGVAFLSCHEISIWLNAIINCFIVCKMNCGLYCSKLMPPAGSGTAINFSVLLNWLLLIQPLATPTFILPSHLYFAVIPWPGNWNGLLQKFMLAANTAILAISFVTGPSIFLLQ